jgi:hypothetical protein
MSEDRIRDAIRVYERMPEDRRMGYNERELEARSLAVETLADFAWRQLTQARVRVRARLGSAGPSPPPGGGMSSIDQSEELWPPLPFDPSLAPPELDPDEATPEELVQASAHAHYYHARQALDLIATSAYQARLAGVDRDTVRACERQAIADHEAERADEFDEVDLESEPDETYYADDESDDEAETDEAETSHRQELPRDGAG